MIGDFDAEIINVENLHETIKIHPAAIIYKGAEISKNVEIGPYSVIGPKVVIDQNVKVGVGAVIGGRTKIGAGTQIFPYATIGSPPQDLKYRGEDSQLIIGENNRIREYVNISIGTEGGGGITEIGNDNLFMVYTHIAHDVVIGSHCIFANSVQIAGHVIIADHVVFGGMAGAHQFCRFGNYAMIAAASVVVQDVPPFCLVQGDRAKVHGLNLVGLKRGNIKGEQLNLIKIMYRIVFHENVTIEEAITRIGQEVSDSPYKSDFIDFLRKSDRGLCR